LMICRLYDIKYEEVKIIDSEIKITNEEYDSIL